MVKKQFASFRLSAEVKNLLKLLAQEMGMSQTAVIELIIREKAKSEGIQEVKWQPAQSPSNPLN